eukprot:GHUV01008397.1.p1 GENE.GHUV01008397.1~~GHUV01008397.1.p1  ORF type:complete len:155 (+),score=28.82 GHUV01008397.1:56-466(+)
MQQTFSIRGLYQRAFAPQAFPGARRTFSVAVTASQADTVKQTVADNKVVVYSKTYCPYCSEAKGLFQKLSVPAKVIELDVIQGGSDLQLGLQEVTGRRTVPQVFIGGKHVGGCDDTIAAYQSGDLKQLLAGVGYQI